MQLEATLAVEWSAREKDRRKNVAYPGYVYPGYGHIPPYPGYGPHIAGYGCHILDMHIQDMAISPPYPGYGRPYPMRAATHILFDILDMGEDMGRLHIQDM